MAKDAWDPGQYARFADERRRPFLDLLALVRPRPGMRVVDLGCGTGELTALAHAQLGAAETVGVDASAAMLERAAAHASPGLRFERGDIAELAADGTYDLILSNAALHWVPDHPALFERLRAALAPGGQLAVQMPDNWTQPTHTVAFEVALESPFLDAMGGYRRRADPVLESHAYAAMLDTLGCAEQLVRQQIYGHKLASRDEVIEWHRGACLTDWQSRLSPELFEAFLVRYRERLLPLLPDRRPFFYPFRRLFLWGCW